MKCVKCGNEASLGTDLCVSCQQKIVFKRLFLFGFGVFFLLIVLCLGLPTFKKITVKHTVYEYLKETYQEDFDVTFLKNEKNTSGDFGFDGSTFFTFPAKGRTFYYKGYSFSSDMEFMAYYDTANQSVTNNYQTLLQRREGILSFYDTVVKFFPDAYDGYISYQGQAPKYKSVKKREEIYFFVSRYQEDYFKMYQASSPPKERLTFYFLGNLKDFVRTHYETLNKLNEELVKKSRQYLNFSVIFVTEDHYELKFNYRGGEACVFEQLDGAYDVILSEYVKM